MYKLIRVVLVLFCCVFFVVKANAQDEKAIQQEVVAVKEKSDFEIAADSMTVIMRTAEALDNVVAKKILSDGFQELLVSTLKKNNSFDFPFDSIPHVGTLLSADGLVRVFSWSIPAEQQGYFYYFGVIQRRVAKTASISDVFVLEDTKSRVMLPEQDVLKYPNWFGCVYYQLVEKKDSRNTYYTLIGHDFNDGISFKKYIDVLTFDKNGNPVFGAPIFLVDKKAQKRVVFEYAAQSVMKVNYYKDMDIIAFNYLFPIVPEKKNDKRYYVSDATHEGLMFKLGKWIKVPNVELKAKD